MTLTTGRNHPLEKPFSYGVEEMDNESLKKMADGMMEFAEECEDDDLMETVLMWANALYDYLRIPADGRCA